MNSYVLWILAHALVLLVGYMVWSGEKKTNKENQKSDDRSGFLANPETCEHKHWSSRYDYTTYPGAVAFREARCLSCGIYERGSCQ